MNVQNIDLINEAKTALKNIYGGRLAKVILYGSYARGEQTAESDIDLLVVLKDADVSAWKEIRFINDSLFPISLQHSVDLSAHAISSQRYETEASFFLNRVRKEGREL